MAVEALNALLADKSLTGYKNIRRRAENIIEKTSPEYFQKHWKTSSTFKSNSTYKTNSQKVEILQKAIKDAIHGLEVEHKLNSVKTDSRKPVSERLWYKKPKTVISIIATILIPICAIVYNKSVDSGPSTTNQVGGDQINAGKDVVHITNIYGDTSKNGIRKQPLQENQRNISKDSIKTIHPKNPIRISIPSSAKNATTVTVNDQGKATVITGDSNKVDVHQE